MLRFPFNKTTANGSGAINNNNNIVVFFKIYSKCLGLMLRTTFTGFFADQEQVGDNASNRIRCTVNPPLNPFHLAYLFQTSFRGRGGG